MLSLSLAFRQQARCIQAAVANIATTNNSNSNHHRLNPVFKPLNTSSALPCTLVPKRYLTVTPARPSSSGGDHVKLWTAEKIVSAAAIPCFILPFCYTTPVTDALFCTLLVLHSHWGIEAIVVDYIRPSLFNGSTTIPNLAQALVWALSAFTLGGLYYFNYSDVGLVNAVKMLWTAV